MLVLWKFALLGKRILFFSPPPIGDVCYRGEFSNISVYYMSHFLANHTNGRAYATVSCLSVCNVYIVAIWCILSKQQIGNGLWIIEWLRIKWLRDLWCRVTPKGQGLDLNILRAQYLENGWR